MTMGSKNLFFKRDSLSRRLMKWAIAVFLLFIPALLLLNFLIKNISSTGTSSVFLKSLSQPIENIQSQPLVVTMVTTPVNPTGLVKAPDQGVVVSKIQTVSTYVAPVINAPELNPVALAKHAPTKVPLTQGSETDTALRNAIELWRTAWQSRDLHTYLGLYGADFSPPQNVSRQVWSNNRKNRITSKQFIELQLQNLSLQIQGKTATVNFTQVYTDERIRLSNRKTMVWQQTDGRWLILSEMSD